jgi:hypothetical protein
MDENVRRADEPLLDGSVRDRLNLIGKQGQAAFAVARDVQVDLAVITATHARLPGKGDP